MNYLHTVSPGIFYLDHRLTPEVRAMLCAMASRMPLGGILARYTEVVEAVAEGLWEKAQEEAKEGDGYENKKTLPTWEKAQETPMFESAVLSTRHQAEDRLCEYPLHSRVQTFFDKFVKMYGHSSIMELSGSPSVYVEGVSWWTAYLLFDNPLVSGQEFSTRAVRHKDWPMARECYVKTKVMYGEGDVEYVGTLPEREELQVGEPLPEKWADIELKEHEIDVPDPKFKDLHDGWFEVFEAEVEAWKQRFSDPEMRAKYGVADKEPFRPALDRARWAIPGTIATGCSQTANMRVMARVLNDGSLLAQKSGVQSVINTWNAIREGYAAAMPGMAEMGLREAVYSPNSKIPGHLQLLHVEPSQDPEDDETVLGFLPNPGGVDSLAFNRDPGARAYVDPSMNGSGIVSIAFQCSLAVSRDWHRHRTFYPWRMFLLRHDGPIQIHHAYEPISEVGKEKVPELLKLSTQVYDECMAAGDSYRAMLALPLGTKVEMSATGGLRDAIYMLELRAKAHGANFEYKAQAENALTQLKFFLQMSETEQVSYLEKVGMDGFDLEFSE